jgi:hypothetical protein
VWPASICYHTTGMNALAMSSANFSKVPTTYTGGAKLDIAAAESDPVGVIHIL